MQITVWDTCWKCLSVMRMIYLPHLHDVLHLVCIPPMWYTIELTPHRITKLLCVTACLIKCDWTSLWGSYHRTQFSLFLVRSSGGCAYVWAIVFCRSWVYTCFLSGKVAWFLTKSFSCCWQHIWIPLWLICAFQWYADALRSLIMFVSYVASLRKASFVTDFIVIVHHHSFLHTCSYVVMLIIVLARAMYLEMPIICKWADWGLVCTQFYPEISVDLRHVIFSLRDPHASVYDIPVILRPIIQCAVTLSHHANNWNAHVSTCDPLYHNGTIPNHGLTGLHSQWITVYIQ